MLLEQIFDAFYESVETCFLNFSIANMAGNETQGNFKQLCHI